MTDHLNDFLLNHYGHEQMRPGLERIRVVLSDLFPYFSKTKIIIVAGTNGKGETTLRLSGLLKDHTHYTWTSPHIERVTERLRDKIGEIDPLLLEELLQECHQKVQTSGIKLSYYEFLFFVFCTWASKNPPEYLLLEVGLGGRLDAVNVFDADLVLLPSISRDHQEILGRRYEQILSEKLGTLRKKTQLIHFLQGDYLCEKAKLISDSVGAENFALREKVTIPEFEFSQRNQLLASAAFCHLQGRSFTPQEWMSSPGQLSNRGESFKEKQEWIFYGSHNVDGMRKLIQFLRFGTYNFPKPPYDGVLVSFSRRSPDDVRVMLKMLKKAGAGKIYTIFFDHPKALDRNVMEALSREEGSEIVEDLKSFVKDLPPGQHLLVTGSYYFLGHLKSLLRS